jgi:pimeloyl-ACP methyl ester carboxylesterase
MYLLHGIYGSGRNWATVARNLCQARPEWGVILVDLRLHGGSLGFVGPHTVDDCARDLAQLEESLALSADAILGHSFGGKVALVRAASGATPKQVWIADTTLRSRPPGGSAWNVLEIVRGLPEEFASRDEVADALERHGHERAVGQWLAMNLERQGDRFVWKLNWEGVEEMLLDFFARDVWPILERPPAGLDIHVIRATRSSAVDAETVERLRAAEAATGQVHLHEIDAGHWLNVDKPEEVLRLLVGSLPEGGF